MSGRVGGTGNDGPYPIYAAVADEVTQLWTSLWILVRIRDVGNPIFSKGLKNSFATRHPQ